MKKYYIITYGCQMNVSDSERIAMALENKGYKNSLKIEEADLIVVNMCSVRQSAVDRVYGLSPKFKKLKAEKIITGCILEKDKKNLLKIFDKAIDINDYFKTAPKYFNNVSINIPIMTGCDNFCSYCVVPYTRGREFSRPKEDIINEIKKLKAKEIWLLGQNVNSYKDGKTGFAELLEMIDKIPGDFWIRFTSSHPKDFSDKLIKVMKNSKKITPYLNLPVQSGDDEILKKMNRPYTIKYYKNLVKKIRKEMPEITLSTDIIVGFPTETKEQFNNAVKLFKEMKFDMAYISQYSHRKGTLAYKMNDDVVKKEKARRAKELTEILSKTALENNKKLIGKELKALITGKKKEFYSGKTESYKTIKIKSDKNILGEFVKIKITDAFSWGLKGEIK